MLILAIDTSAAASVALVDGERVVAERTEFSARRHVEYVGPALLEVLAAGPRPDVVAVGVGPGPFTGLRAGIAAGIGAALGADVPVHGIVSHDALALRILETEAARTDAHAADSAGAVRTSSVAPEAPVLVATDARRREVYASLFSGLDADGLPVVLAGPTVLAPAAVADWLLAEVGEKPVHRAGRGFVLHRDVLGSPDDEEPDALDPTAAWVARVAHRALTASRPLPGTEPLYLREPDAVPAPRRSTPLS